MRPDDSTPSLTVVDTHYGGDVSRIVMGGVGTIPGASLPERVHYLRSQADGLRQLLIYEPHGNPQMCVDLVVPVSPAGARAGAAAGYIIMEAMGYPPFSGSNTVCTTTALLESGALPMREGEQSLVLESPSGLVDIRAQCAGGRVVSVTCESPPTFVVQHDLKVRIPVRGELQIGLVWSGCFYAVVDAEPLSLLLVPEERHLIAELGAAIVDAANPILDLEHPELGPMGPLAFVHFAGPRQRVDASLQRSRSVTYVHPGVVCRCPTGTGTSARLALLDHAGSIGVGERLETVAPDGSRFVGAITGHTRVGDYDAVRTALTGRAWTLAHSEIVVDFADPMIRAEGLAPLLASPETARP